MSTCGRGTYSRCDVGTCLRPRTNTDTRLLFSVMHAHNIALAVVLALVLETL